MIVKSFGELIKNIDPSGPTPVRIAKEEAWESVFLTSIKVSLQSL